MTCSAAEKRQIFLACKAIFTGPNSLLRKPRTIQKRITEHQAALNTSIPNFEVNRVTNIVKALLEEQVFQSDIKAKTKFPDLFTPSPAKKAKCNVFETEAARSAAGILEEITFVHEKGSERTQAPPVPLSVELQAPAEAEVRVKGDTNSSPESAVEPRLPMPSLYPSYFPYSAQHSVLSGIQHVLEECCFYFTKKWLPSEVNSHEWDCAAAMELTEWTKFLAKWSPQLPHESLQLTGSQLDTLLPKICQIRHTAVHRLPITASDVSLLVLAAKRLAEALQDHLRTSQLEDLHSDIQNKIQAMELNKNTLEDNHAHELKAIKLQREELDQKEEQLRAKIINSNKENKSLMGLLVKESIRRIFNDKKRALDDDSVGFETEDDGADNINSPGCQIL